jgi:hypothetical protein
MMLCALHDDMANVIALQAIFVRCSDNEKRDVLDRMSNTFEGVTFIKIRDAMHMTLIQALMRMHDKDPKASSIHNVLATLRDPKVIEAIKTEKWAVSLDVHAELASVRTIRNGEDFRACLKATERLRNWHIAHSEFDPADHGAKYGQEKRLMEATIRIMQHLEVVLSGEARSEDYDYWKRYWRRSSDEFWSHVALPAQERELVDDEDEEEGQA